MPTHAARCLCPALVCCAIGLVFGRAADDGSITPEAEYAILLSLSRAQLPAALRWGDEAAKIAWLRKRHDELHTRGPAFLVQHATHPLRWDVLVLLRYGGKQRERVYRSGFRQLIPEPESTKQWEAAYFPRLVSLLAAPDARADARGEALRQLIEHTSNTALPDVLMARQAIAPVRQWLDQYDREFPRSRYTLWLYRCHAALLDEAAPQEHLAFLRELEQRYQGSDFFDQGVREFVEGQRRALEAQALPVTELWAQVRQFDSVHGNPEQYRGRVVLLAVGPVTYPTFTESLEDLHAKYSDAGLVILQIASFNRAYGLPPEPQQRQDMEKIVAIRRWPWPVLWNPRGHMNFVGRWGFNSVPARMLIGRDGRLVIDRGHSLSATIALELARPASAEH
jgi:hypothetical protein